MISPICIKEFVVSGYFRTSMLKKCGVIGVKEVWEFEIRIQVHLFHFTAANNKFQIDTYNSLTLATTFDCQHEHQESTMLLTNTVNTPEEKRPKKNQIKSTVNTLQKYNEEGDHAANEVNILQKYSEEGDPKLVLRVESLEKLGENKLGKQQCYRYH